MEEVRMLSTFQEANLQETVRPRRRWEDIIRIDLKEMGVNMRNWVDSAQDRDYWRDLVNVALNLRVS